MMCVAREAFGRSVRWVDFAIYPAELNVLTVPFLNGKMLDVDVPGTFCWLSMANDVDDGFVVDKDCCWRCLQASHFVQYGSDVSDLFCTQDGGNEFCFCGTSGNNSLGLGLVSNGDTERMNAYPVVDRRCANLWHTTVLRDPRNPFKVSL